MSIARCSAPVQSIDIRPVADEDRPVASNRPTRIMSGKRGEIIIPPRTRFCFPARYFTHLKMRADNRIFPSRPKRFFQEWDRLFGVVYGQDIGRAEKAAEETARLYRLPSGADLKPLLFSIHTYYAWLMKMIAVELLSLQPESVTRGFTVELASLDDNDLQCRLTDLESGQPFISAGIENFLEGDFFSWYLDVWTPQVARNLREAARLLGAFEPGTPRLEPQWTQDLLRNLYEIVVPKKLRHDLGEYYTPDWLAQHLMDRAGYDGDLDKRFLDPACGSGTFLIHAIRRCMEKTQTGRTYDPAKTGTAILHNVVGFDLNPLAVLAARTNYLISIADLLPYTRPVSLPVYLCDSVVPLEEPSNGPLFPAETVVFSTHHRDYVFPLSMKTQARIDAFTSEVEKSLRADISMEGFSKGIKKALDLAESEIKQLTEVYRQIKELHDQKQDGIWAKYIKNAFAPEYIGAFDYVIGNPPWIRWKYLSSDYRAKTMALWHKYGIFSLKGQEARLGAGEKDFSMFFTYACADRYLKDGGRLVFLITETVFKARGGGEGFRSFVLPENNVPLKMIFMEDMVDLNPFLTASNKTCLFALERGSATTYPVPVIKWFRKKGVGRIKPEWSYEEVMGNTKTEKRVAVPVDSKKSQSSWQTIPINRLDQMDKMKGQNPYEIRRGADTAPYGVFRVKIDEVRPDGLVVIENLTEMGNADIRKVKAQVESQLIYPAINGPEIIRFGISGQFYIVLTQDPSTREPRPKEWMEENAPWTLAYLRPYEKILLNRGSKPIAELARRTAFYAMFGIGDYSVAPYRVT
ncbi:MAG: N-6 DNA methylase [Chitinispirillaceae bacterium]|nr:N-6 DNA methylase [Chitinispirillaceae bacterium]